MVDRNIIGYRGGVPGIFVSKPGYDVKTCTEAQLMLNAGVSPMAQIVLSGHDYGIIKSTTALTKTLSFGVTFAAPPKVIVFYTETLLDYNSSGWYNLMVSLANRVYKSTPEEFISSKYNIIMGYTGNNLSVSVSTTGVTFKFHTLSVYSGTSSSAYTYNIVYLVLRQ